jgi:hydroxymethylpyrimidine pyrophosphatase-like HAD family hydrolase
MVGKTVVAVGDYTNDLELLKEADIAVAVDNALPEVKAVADHVICSNNDDALAFLIEQLLPKL